MISLEELNRLYVGSEEVDKPIFAEQRSNVLLYAGEHYSKEGNRKFWDRIRENRALSAEARIRLTKNHTQKIINNYVDSIMGLAPGVKCFPQNDKELQDIKAAELHNSVLDYIKRTNNHTELHLRLCSSFVKIGEVFVKTFWDPYEGDFLRYDTTQKEDGSLEKKPVFSGALVHEEYYGFNVLRPKDCKDLNKAPWLCLRKMADVKSLKKKLADDPEKQKMVEASIDDTFIIFDATQGGYIESKDQVMLREFYFRPCMEYPMGYYSISTKAGILWEGELPFGIYPIDFALYSGIETSPRGRSPIKTIRPYQAEINRAGSKIAEHQITLGDDKLVTNQNQKVASGAQLAGIRQVTVTGAAPTVISGRSGEQYIGYMNDQITELYNVMDVPEEEGALTAQQDPYAMLFASLKQKKKHGTQAGKFEDLLVRMYTKGLEIFRKSAPDDIVVPVIGKREVVNMPEFKSQEKLGYLIKVEPVSDDLDSVMGKQLVLNHVLQFAGSQLTRDDFGKIVRNMPLLNVGEMFDDMTLDYDSATNIILALDRGSQPIISPSDNLDYLLKRIVNRTRGSDFSILPEPVKDEYLKLITYLEDKIAQREQQLQQAQKGWIPVSGAMIDSGIYVPDPTNKARTRRLRLPYDSVYWLWQKIEAQGSSLENLELQAKSTQADIATRQQQLMAAQPPPEGGPAPTQDVMPNQGS